MADVLVIAGTSDARRIISGLVKLKVGVAATVTTGYGSELLKEFEGVEIFEGRLDSCEMASLMARIGAKCVVDASHPFAREASVNAMKACEQTGVPYIRYEREEAHIGGSRVICAESCEEAAELASKSEGNILVTVGSKNLRVFVEKIPDYKKRLFARVLPDSRIIAGCEELGLSAGNIIAMRGPFSEGMNMEMIKYCEAKLIVTKDSGNEGGVPEKLMAAEKTGIAAIVVKRPEVPYPVKSGSIDETVEKVRKLLASGGRC